MLRQLLSQPATYEKVLSKKLDHRLGVTNALGRAFTPGDMVSLGLNRRGRLPRWARLISGSLDSMAPDSGRCELKVHLILRSFAINAINLVCNRMRAETFTFSRLRAGAFAKDPEATTPAVLPLGKYQSLSVETKSEYRMTLKATYPDQLVLYALRNVLAEAFPSDGFLPGACGYIPGRGGREVVKQVLAHLNAELRCVLRFDVTSFNETVKQVELLHLLKEGVRKLPGWTEEDTILFVQLLQDYFRRVSEALKTPGVGIGMGSPLTPFFTNIYLDQLDRFLQGRGVPFVRYGDDISAFFHTPGEAAEMKDRVRGFINECLGQKIKDEKTVIACLDISETGADMPQGFDFCAFHYFVTASEAVDVRIKNKTLQKVRRSIRYFTFVGDDAEAQPVPFRGIQLDGRTWTAIIDIGLRLGFPERKTSPMEPIPDHMLTRFSGQGWPNAFLKEARSEAMKLQFRELDRYIRYRLQRIERRLGGETSKESEFYHRMRRFGLRSFMDAWNRQPKLSEA